MVVQNNNITASDINAIITKINNEENSRGVGLSDIGSVSQYAKILGQKFKDMVNRNTSINNHHCYCEADAGRDAGDTTKTGTTLSLTASTGDYDVGDGISAANINEIDTDIDNLVAQCDCDTYAQSTGCSCNTVCTCEGDCSCVSQGCGCNTDCLCDDYSCSCNIDVCGSCSGHCALVCSCELNCTCQNQGCGTYCACNTDTSSCGNNCDCNTFACTCESQCTCQSQCLCQAFCGCDTNCSCDLFKCYLYCDDYCHVCICETNQDLCTCDGICGCNTDCGCDDVCNCDDDCSCFSECLCDKVCTCEYN